MENYDFERHVEDELNDPRVVTLVGIHIWAGFIIDPHTEFTLQGYHDVMTRDMNRLQAFIPKPEDPHCGDCTRVPAPCNRCYMERAVDESKEKLEKLTQHESLTFEEIVALYLCEINEFNEEFSKIDFSDMSNFTSRVNEMREFDTFVNLYVDNQFNIPDGMLQLARQLIQDISL